MKILAIEQEASPASEDDLRPFLKSEAAHVWELYQAGVLREIYFRADKHNAVLVLECTSPEAAQHLLSQFPLVRQGFISFEVIPLAPYPGFARLFAS